jgi:ArsR family transcriptional regulator
VRAGLVQAEREGRHLIYRPAIEQMNAVIAYLTDHCCQGEDCGVRRPPVRVPC